VAIAVALIATATVAATKSRADRGISDTRGPRGMVLTGERGPAGPDLAPVTAGALGEHLRNNRADCSSELLHCVSTPTDSCHEHRYCSRVIRSAYVLVRRRSGTLPVPAPPSAVVRALNVGARRKLRASTREESL
jgi:hypothetical protein